MTPKTFFSRSITVGLLFGLGVALQAQSSATATAKRETSAANKGAVKTVRLLTIGNSFSANATEYLGDLAKAGGHTLVHRPIVVGGASFELHAGKMQAHARDPLDKAGLYTNGRSLLEQLKMEPWNFVTLQQASIESHDPATFEPFATQLRDFIRENAPQAKLLVHQTWAYRVDDPRFTKPASSSLADLDPTCHS